MHAIKQRLDLDLEIKHPTRNEMLTDGPDDANTRQLRTRLSEAISNLEVLFHTGCTRLDALRAWNCVFKHDYWKNLIAAEEEVQKQKNKEETAELLRGGNGGVALAAGLLSVGAAAVAHAKVERAVKETRSYGSNKEG